jgi:hypothetical protein
MMAKWEFIRKRFNGKGEPQQLGSIRTPDGYWFCAVESDFALDTTDEAILEQVLKVLNRELPDGKPRNRKAQKVVTDG